MTPLFISVNNLILRRPKFVRRKGSMWNTDGNVIIWCFTPLSFFCSLVYTGSQNFYKVIKRGNFHPVILCVSPPNSVQIDSTDRRFLSMSFPRFPTCARKLWMLSTPTISDTASISDAKNKIISIRLNIALIYVWTIFCDFNLKCLKLNWRNDYISRDWV